MRAEEIFGKWEETIIWSCLQGVMGKIYTNSPEDNAAMAVLGDFVFLAGKPCEELVRFNPKESNPDFMIMVPQSPEWAALIEKCFGEKARKVSRYAMKKERDVFDKEKLQQAFLHLQEGYELKLLEEDEFKQCRKNQWSMDLVAQFKDYPTYKELGLGVVILKEGELVAGASAYSRYREGIEIEIDTKEGHRRKGLAYACGAKLILECLERNLYPSWDAHNLWSVGLAQKLGYHYSHTYTAYEIQKRADTDKEILCPPKTPMPHKDLLSILSVAEKLKCNTRHADTSNGRRESVAEHSWRTALMAMLLEEEFPDTDIHKVIKMCLIHDLGEAFTGDIPAFDKTKEHSEREEQLLQEWIESFPEGLKKQFQSLLAEMAELKTKEARLYKALDKLEAVIQHNEADIASWLPLEYDLQLTYGGREVQFSPYLVKLKEYLNEQTREKIQKAQNSNN